VSTDFRVLVTRLIADRRGGVDRRAVSRRHAVGRVGREQRQVVDRRGGPERRSTLDRRGRQARDRATESPGEHLRNALQLLTAMDGISGLSPDDRADLRAVLERLQRALRLLERRSAV